MPQKWLDFSVTLPGNQIVDASKVRARLAATVDANPAHSFNPAIFNYSEDGRPLQGVSPFRFGGGKQFHIYAVGDEAVGILNAEGHKITSLLGESYGNLLCEQRKSGIFGARLTGGLNRFRIHLLVLQQKPSHYKKLMAMSAADRNEYADTLIRQGLAEHFRKMGVPLELDDPQLILGDTQINDDVFPVQVKPDIWFLTAKNVTFRANLELSGIYHAGHLVSRGYGRILRERDAVSK